MRVFVLEALTRAAEQAKREDCPEVGLEHLEKILPQFLLDFAWGRVFFASHLRIKIPAKRVRSSFSGFPGIASFRMGRLIFLIFISFMWFGPYPLKVIFSVIYATLKFQQIRDVQIEA